MGVLEKRNVSFRFRKRTTIPRICIVRGPVTIVTELSRHLRCLGAFPILRKAAVGFVTPARQSEWSNSAPTESCFLKFHILVFFRKFVEKIQVLLKLENNNGYFTLRPMYIYNKISQNCS